MRTLMYAYPAGKCGLCTTAAPRIRKGTYNPKGAQGAVLPGAVVEMVELGYSRQILSLLSSVRAQSKTAGVEPSVPLSL